MRTTEYLASQELIPSSGPRVSVLLPYRNAASTIEEALASVLDDDDLPLEVIAIDDGSTDDGPGRVASAGRGDARVVPCAVGGVGIVGALSRGLALARAPLIARMDSDDVSLPGRFAAQAAMLDADPSLGAVGALVEGFPDPGDGLRLYIEWLNSLRTPDDHRRDLFVEAPLCHPSVMLRREALERVGGWREQRWAEDYDLWLRLDEAGYGLAKVPRLLLRWRQRPGRETFSNPVYGLDRLREARARYLAPRLLRARLPVVVWGAGPTGRRLCRALEPHGVRASAFVDIDPRKIGRTARDAPIVPPSALRPGQQVIVVAVGARGARGLIRAQLAAMGMTEGHDFVCAS